VSRVPIPLTRVPDLDSTRKPIAVKNRTHNNNMTYTDSPSVSVRDGHQVLNFERYSVHLLSILNTRLTTLASQQYLQQFGMGSTEMKVLASLGYCPDQKAVELCELISIDKAAASRALTKLGDAGMVEGRTQSPAGKQKRWSLTPKGWQLHQTFLAAVMDREEKLANGISPIELKRFTDTMHKLLANLEKIKAEPETGRTPTKSINTVRESIK